ncbi:MAG TPA: anti-sigma factor [Hanamia sp.]
MNIEEFISSGLLELYAMGICSPGETKTVEDFLVEYPEARAELSNIEISLEKYAQANSIQPASSVKEKVFNEIFPNASKEVISAPVVPITKSYSGARFYKLVAAAVFILLIGSVVLNYTYFEKYHDAKNGLDVALQTIEQQSKKNEAMSTDLDVVTNKYTLPVVLKGTPHAPDAVAKIFWIKNTGQVYVDPTNLPTVPEGKQYQLWAIVDGKPESAGMIETSNGIYHIQKMKSFGKADAFAITLEKAGGSPTPTMDQMVVFSKM